MLILLIEYESSLPDVTSHYYIPFTLTSTIYLKQVPDLISGQLLKLTVSCDKVRILLIY